MDTPRVEDLNSCNKITKMLLTTQTKLVNKYSEHILMCFLELSLMQKEHYWDARLLPKDSVSEEMKIECNRNVR